MNADEGVSLAKMAVTVLLVVLVIGAVVAIVYAAYSWFTSGSDKLSSQVTSIDKASYSQYDDTTVSGTDVLSALKSYRESDVGIFIVNKNQNTYSSSHNDGDTINCANYCALTADAYGGGIDTSTFINSYAATVRFEGGQWFFDNGLSWDQTTNQLYRNTNFSPTTTNSNANCFVKQSARWYANLVYDTTTGDIAGILFQQMN